MINISIKPAASVSSSFPDLNLITSTEEERVLITKILKSSSHHLISCLLNKRERSSNNKCSKTFLEWYINTSPNIEITQEAIRNIFFCKCLPVIRAATEIRILNNKKKLPLVEWYLNSFSDSRKKISAIKNILASQSCLLISAASSIACSQVGINHSMPLFDWYIKKNKDLKGKRQAIKDILASRNKSIIENMLLSIKYSGLSRQSTSTIRWYINTAHSKVDKRNAIRNVIDCGVCQATKQLLSSKGVDSVPCLLSWYVLSSDTENDKLVSISRLLTSQSTYVLNFLYSNYCDNFPGSYLRYYISSNINDTHLESAVETILLTRHQKIIDLLFQKTPEKNNRYHPLLPRYLLLAKKNGNTENAVRRILLSKNSKSIELLVKMELKKNLNFLAYYIKEAKEPIELRERIKRILRSKNLVAISFSQNITVNRAPSVKLFEWFIKSGESDKNKRSAIKSILQTQSSTLLNSITEFKLETNRHNKTSSLGWYLLRANDLHEKKEAVENILMSKSISAISILHRVDVSIKSNKASTSYLSWYIGTIQSNKDLQRVVCNILSTKHCSSIDALYGFKVKKHAISIIKKLLLEDGTNHTKIIENILLSRHSKSIALLIRESGKNKNSYLKSYIINNSSSMLKKIRATSCILASASTEAISIYNAATNHQRDFGFNWYIQQYPDTDNKKAIIRKILYSRSEPAINFLTKPFTKTEIHNTYNSWLDWYIKNTNSEEDKLSALNHILQSRCKPAISFLCTNAPTNNNKQSANYLTKALLSSNKARRSRAIEIILSSKHTKAIDYIHNTSLSRNNNVSMISWYLSNYSSEQDLRGKITKILSCIHSQSIQLLLKIDYNRYESLLHWYIDFSDCDNERIKSIKQILSSRCKPAITAVSDITIKSFSRKKSLSLFHWYIISHNITEDRLTAIKDVLIGRSSKLIASLNSSVKLKINNKLLPLLNWFFHQEGSDDIKRQRFKQILSTGCSTVITSFFEQENLTDLLRWYLDQEENSYAVKDLLSSGCTLVINELSVMAACIARKKEKLTVLEKYIREPEVDSFRYKAIKDILITKNHSAIKELVEKKHFCSDNNSISFISWYVVSREGSKDKLDAILDVLSSKDSLAINALQPVDILYKNKKKLPLFFWFSIVSHEVYSSEELTIKLLKSRLNLKYKKYVIENLSYQRPALIDKCYSRLASKYNKSMESVIEHLSKHKQKTG